MKKDEAVKYIETKGDESFVVRTENEEKTFLENYGKQIEEEKIKPEIGKYLNELDEELFKITGLKRNSVDTNGNLLPLNQREKTGEFLKRVFDSHKSYKEKSSVLEGEITILKQQIKDGTGDKKTAADLEAVQKAYKELQETSAKRVSDLEKANEQRQIRYEITSALAGYNYKKGITEPVRKAFVDQVINELAGTAELREGKLVFLDKAGNPLRNPHNALNAYSAKELLDERLKEIIDVGKKLEGGPDITTEIQKEYKDGKLIKASIVVPDSVKTKSDLGDFLVSQKILRNTPEYIMLYAEYGKTLPMK